MEKAIIVREKTDLLTVEVDGQQQVIKKCSVFSADEIQISGERGVAPRQEIAFGLNEEVTNAIAEGGSFVVIGRRLVKID